MTPERKREPKLHHIGIRIDGKGFVYTTPDRPDASTVYVKKGDFVKWNCSHGNYSVLFKSGTPFQDIGAHGRGGADTHTLEVIGEPGPYKYAVNVALPNGLVVDDPVIIVGDDGGD
ncbi:MAG TPA: hypothetical protein VK789_19895 [Bryobacteraceae bacterium]|jgi:hypothetical protein|nr:hypothetical protein [Bryobacteraceae bacterium]